MAMAEKEGPDSFWTAALKVAGLAAVALFVMYQLYDHYLELGNLAKLTATQSFVVSLVLIALIFVVTIVGMVLWYRDNQGARQNKRELALNSAKTIPGGIQIGIARGWTFRHAATAVASSAKSTIRFVGFKDAELNAKLRPQTLEAKNVATILQRIGETALETIPPYTVEAEDGRYILAISERAQT
jgi:hypothetical protein